MRATVGIRMLAVAGILVFSLGGDYARSAPQLRVDLLPDYDGSEDLITTALHATASSQAGQVIQSRESAGAYDAAAIAARGVSEKADPGTWTPAATTDMMSWPEPRAIEPVPGNEGLLLDPAIPVNDGAGNGYPLLGPIEASSATWIDDGLDPGHEESSDNAGWVVMPSAIALGLLGIGLLIWRYMYREPTDDELQPPLLVGMQMSGNRFTPETDRTASAVPARAAPAVPGSSE